MKFSNLNCTLNLKLNYLKIFRFGFSLNKAIQKNLSRDCHKKKALFQRWLAKIFHAFAISILWCLLIFFFGCQTSKQAIMTREDFGDILIGTDTQDLIKQYGEPFSISYKGNDIYEYEYIERLLLGREVVVQRRYYILVKDGKVIEKHRSIEQPPAYKAIYSDEPIPNNY